VRVDPVRHIASEGSVSVIDLKPTEVKSEALSSKSEILTGLHASGDRTLAQRALGLGRQLGAATPLV